MAALAGQENDRAEVSFGELQNAAQGRITDNPVPFTIDDNEPHGTRPDQPFRCGQGVGVSSRTDNGDSGKIDSPCE